MKKINYLLLVGIVSIIISILIFSFMREDVSHVCINAITCENLVNYFHFIYAPIFLIADCANYCIVANPDYSEITINVPNQSFIIFAWIGFLSLII